MHHFNVLGSDRRWEEVGNKSPSCLSLLRKEEEGAWSSGGVRFKPCPDAEPEVCSNKKENKTLQ